MIFISVRCPHAGLDHGACHLICLCARGKHLSIGGRGVGCRRHAQWSHVAHAVIEARPDATEIALRVMRLRRRTRRRDIPRLTVYAEGNSV